MQKEALSCTVRPRLALLLPALAVLLVIAVVQSGPGPSSPRLNPKRPALGIGGTERKQQGGENRPQREAPVQEVPVENPAEKTQRGG